MTGGQDTPCPCFFFQAFSTIDVPVAVSDLFTLLLEVSTSTSKMVLLHIYHCVVATTHKLDVGNCGSDHTNRLQNFGPFFVGPSTLFK